MVCSFPTSSLVFCYYQIDEEEMSLRRDLSVPTSLEAPTIDLTSTTARRYCNVVASLARCPNTYAPEFFQIVSHRLYSAVVHCLQIVVELLVAVIGCAATTINNAFLPI